MTTNARLPSTRAEPIPPRPRKSRAGIVTVLTMMAVLVILAGLGAYALLTARTSLLDGVHQLDDAQTQLEAARTSGHLRPALQSAGPDLRHAYDDFNRGRSWLAPLAPVITHLGWLPRYGDQLAAAPALADVGTDTTSGLRSLLAGLAPLADRLGTGSNAHLPAPLLLSSLARGGGHFNAACTSFHQATLARRTIGSIHSPTLISALRTVDSRLPGLHVLCRGLAAAPSLLGYYHPRTYLFAYQDPLELRSTGGFIGSAGLVTLRDGRVHQQFHDSGFKDENFTVPSPEPVRYYNTEPFWLFRDSNWSPDFPTTAALERFFARLDLHRNVQAVVDLTPAAAADMLAATGPLFVPEYRQTVTSANIAQLADYYAHWAPTPGPNPAGGGKQFIQIVARRLFARLESLSPATWIRLGQTIGSAVRNRDLLVNFADPREQSLVRLSGADGAINRTSSDYLYVVDTNLSYNKINPYIHERISYHVSVGPDRWLHNQLTIHLATSAPQSIGVHGIGPGAGALGGPLDYADFVRIYVPYGSQITSQSGWTQPWSPGDAYGRTMFCGYVIVRHNRSLTITVRYDVPPNVFSATNGREYRLVVQRQPGRRLDNLSISVGGSGVSARRWSVADQMADLIVSEPIAHRSFSPIPLAPQPPTVVAPGHWVEPHAYLAPPH